MTNRIFTLLFLISPLIIAPGLPYPYTFPRWIFIATICALWSLLLAYQIFKKKIVISINRLDVAFLVFVAALAAATVLSVSPVASLFGSIERSFGFAFWLMMVVAYFGLQQTLKLPAEKLFAWKTFMITVLISCVWGVMQRIIPGFSQTFSGIRVGGTLGNAIFFGMYLTLSVGVLCFFITSTQELKQRTAWWYIAIGTAVLACIVLLLTQSRGPLLGLVCGAVAAGISTILLNGKIQRYIRITAAVLCMCAAAAAVTIYAHQASATTTAQTRLLNWQMAWHGFLDKPILGWGPEQYRRAADAHFEPRLSEYGLDETHADKPHNFFLEIAVTSGVIGFATYIALIITAVYCVIWLMRAGNLTKNQGIACIGLLVAYSTQNLTAFETHGTAIVLIFILSELSTRIHARSDKKLTPKFVPPLFALLPLVAACISLFGAWIPLRDSRSFVLTQSSDKPYSEKHDAINKLQQHLFTTVYELDYFKAISAASVWNFWQNPSTRAKLSANEQTELASDLTTLTSDISTLQQSHQKDGVCAITLGSSAFQLYALTHNNDNASQTEQLFNSAHSLSPHRQEPLLQLAQLSLLKNEPEKTIAHLTDAISFDPQFGTPYLYRSLAYFTIKNYAAGWLDVKKLIALNYKIEQPTIAEYIYTSLLAAHMNTEADAFKQYFEKSL